MSDFSKGVNIHYCLKILMLDEPIIIIRILCVIFYVVVGFSLIISYQIPTFLYQRKGILLVTIHFIFSSDGSTPPPPPPSHRQTKTPCVKAGCFCFTGSEGAIFFGKTKRGFHQRSYTLPLCSYYVGMGELGL